MEARVEQEAYKFAASRQPSYSSLQRLADEAMRELREAVQCFEQILEKKSEGRIPTAKQLHFLFRHRVPSDPEPDKPKGNGGCRW